MPLSQLASTSESAAQKADSSSGSTDQSNVDRWRVWKRRCCWLVVVWILSTVLMSIPFVRGLVALPLYVHHPDATGQAAYVMADGHAYWERLRAASDLFHRKQVAQIIILDEAEPAGFNFEREQIDTRTQRAIDYLALFGVPNECVETIPIQSSAFGSLSEARGFAKQYPGINRVVVVTSAPHTRRSLLSFRRSLSDSVSVEVYSASSPANSAEISVPLWQEYAKLIVYFFVAG